MFINKVLLITGGTGSFGNAVLKRFLDTDIGAGIALAHVVLFFLVSTENTNFSNVSV